MPRTRAQSHHIGKNRLFRGLVSIFLALTLAPALPLHVSALNVGGPSDCDANAMIRCGVHSTDQLATAYNQDSYLRKVFGDYGISSAEMQNMSNTAVAGRVTRSGKVYIDGQSTPVATNATTGGRLNMPGSTAVTTQGATYYRRPTSVSFKRNSLPAFVSMQNGTFQMAILASCGNVVIATPVTSKPAPPAPTTPAPAPTPAPTVTPPAPVVTTPAPEVITSTPAPPVVQPSVSTTPLPNTGPVGFLPVAGGVSFASFAGTLLYRSWLLKRFR